MSIAQRLYLKRLTSEISKLSLPETQRELAESGIFIILNEDNINEIHFVIFGAENTPYQYCPLFFKLEIPLTYPHTPPIGKFITTNGKTRFNPNLYVNGKICLSILGTWQGPGWTSTMTIHSVINSIQALVMNETPIINEPIYETTTSENISAYNYYVEYYSIKHALCEQLLTIYNYEPFSNIKTELYTYFLKFSQKILERLDILISINQNKLVSCKYENINEQYDYIILKEKVIELINIINDYFNIRTS